MLQAKPDQKQTSEVSATVEIRLLAPGDHIPELTRLLHRAYKPLADAGMRYMATHQDDRTTLYRTQRGECYLAVEGSRIIGTVTFIPPDRSKGSPWYDRPDVASFGQFAVDPDFQGKGLGAKLMDLVESRARATGAVEIALDTSEHAEHLIEKYSRRGYRFIEYAQWQDVNYRSVIMSKTL